MRNRSDSRYTNKRLYKHKPSLKGSPLNEITYFFQDCSCTQISECYTITVTKIKKEKTEKQDVHKVFPTLKSNDACTSMQSEKELYPMKRFPYLSKTFNLSHTKSESLLLLSIYKEYTFYSLTLCHTSCSLYIRH